MKFVGKFSDKIIVYSKIGENALIEYYGVTKEKIVTSNLSLTVSTTIQNQEKRKKYELIQMHITLRVLIIFLVR